MIQAYMIGTDRGTIYVWGPSDPGMCIEYTKDEYQDGLRYGDFALGNIHELDDADLAGFVMFVEIREENYDSDNS